jgi:hypothetical protein
MRKRFLPSSAPIQPLTRAHPAPPPTGCGGEWGWEEETAGARGGEGRGGGGGGVRRKTRLAGAEVLGWGKSWGSLARRAVLSRRWREEAWQLAKALAENREMGRDP